MSIKRVLHGSGGEIKSGNIKVAEVKEWEISMYKDSRNYWNWKGEADVVWDQDSEIGKEAFSEALLGGRMLELKLLDPNSGKYYHGTAKVENKSLEKECNIEICGSGALFEDGKDLLSSVG